MPGAYIPIFLFLLVAIAFVTVVFIVSWLAQPEKYNKVKLEPYECGIVPLQEPVQRFPVKFYLVAMLYVIFDIEIVFLYPWAVILRQFKIFALLEMAAFVGVLLVGYFYVWKKGAFDWE